MLVPVPSSLVAEGLVWLPEQAQVRATVDGQVETLWVREQQAVAKGDALLTLKSPGLQTRRQVLVAQMEQQEAEFHTAFGVDSLRMQNAQNALDRDRMSLAKLEEELASQTLRAGVSGTFVLYRPTDLEGDEVKKGDVIGHVIGRQHTVIRAVVPQSMIDDVRERLQSVSVMLDERPGQAVVAKWLGEVPAASNALPAEVLADRMGGRVATLTDDQHHVRPSEPIFVVDVAIPEALQRAGGLARVKFHLSSQSLGQTWSKRVRQLFLRHFSLNDT